MLPWLHVLTSAEGTGTLGAWEQLQLLGRAASSSVAFIFVDLVGIAVQAYQLPALPPGLFSHSLLPLRVPEPIEKWFGNLRQVVSWL